MQKQLKLMEMPAPEWIDLLKQEVAKPGNTITSVAKVIGMPRPSLSLLLSGNYPAKMDKKSKNFAALVIQRFAHQTWCPHLNVSLSADTCRKHAGAPMSKSDPDALRHWVACKACPQNPNRKDTPDAI